jgi:hypothetical protein
MEIQKMPSLKTALITIAVVLVGMFVLVKFFPSQAKTVGLTPQA